MLKYQQLILLKYNAKKTPIKLDLITVYFFKMQTQETLIKDFQNFRIKKTKPNKFQSSLKNLLSNFRNSFKKWKLDGQKKNFVLATLNVNANQVSDNMIAVVFSGKKKIMSTRKISPKYLAKTIIKRTIFLWN